MSSRLAFDTTTYPREQRQSAFTAHIQDVLFDASIQPYDASLDIKVAGYGFDDVTALSFDVNSHTVQRTGDLIARSPKDAVFISVILEGQTTYCSPKRDVVMTPGTALIYSASDAYLLSQRRNTRQLFLDLPADFARETFQVENLSDPHHVNVANVNLPLPVDELASKVVESSPTASTYESLMKLVAALVHEAQKEEGSLLVQKVRKAAKDAAPDHDSDSQTVSDMVGYSLRHLNRMMAEQGTTVARELSDARVARAKSLLEARDLSLIEVAAQSGFGSTTTLRRQLLRRGIV